MVPQIVNTLNSDINQHHVRNFLAPEKPVDMKALSSTSSDLVADVHEFTDDNAKALRVQGYEDLNVCSSWFLLILHHNG